MSDVSDRFLSTSVRSTTADRFAGPKSGSESSSANDASSLTPLSTGASAAEKRWDSRMTIDKEPHRPSSGSRRESRRGASPAWERGAALGDSPRKGGGGARARGDDRSRNRSRSRSPRGRDDYPHSRSHSHRSRSPYARRSRSPRRHDDRDRGGRGGRGQGGRRSRSPPRHHRRSRSPRGGRDRDRDRDRDRFDRDRHGPAGPPAPPPPPPQYGPLSGTADPRWFFDGRRRAPPIGCARPGRWEHLDASADRLCFHAAAIHATTFGDRYQIFISQLSQRVTEDDLHDLLALLRCPASVRVVRDPHSGRSRGMAFASFPSVSLTYTATRLGGQLLYGAPIAVELAAALPGAAAVDTASSAAAAALRGHVTVTGLPFGVTSGDVVQHIVPRHLKPLLGLVATCPDSLASCTAVIELKALRRPVAEAALQPPNAAAADTDAAADAAPAPVPVTADASAAVINDVGTIAHVIAPQILAGARAFVAARTARAAEAAARAAEAAAVAESAAAATGNGDGPSLAEAAADAAAELAELQALSPDAAPGLRLPATAADRMLVSVDAGPLEVHPVFLGIAGEQQKQQEQQEQQEKEQQQPAQEPVAPEGHAGAASDAT